MGMCSVGGGGGSLGPVLSTEVRNGDESSSNGAAGITEPCRYPSTDAVTAMAPGPGMPPGLPISLALVLLL